MSRRVFIIEDESVAREIEAMLERKRINIERRRVSSYRRPIIERESGTYCGGEPTSDCGNYFGSCGGSMLYDKRMYRLEPISESCGIPQIISTCG